MSSHGYRSVPGSLALRTRKTGTAPELEHIEQLDTAQPFGVVFAGDTLARTVVRDRYVPVLFDVFDRVLPGLPPTAQVVYVQLYRLALADERNFCRTKQRELMERTGLSERRLLAAIAELVEARCVAILDRTRQGTLYRVRLPHEVAGAPIPDSVFMKRAPVDPKPAPLAAAQGGTRAARRPRTAARTPLAAVAGASDAPGALDTSSAAALAASFRAHAGAGHGSVDDALEAVLDLLERGHPLPEVASLLARFLRSAGRRDSVNDLPRILGLDDRVRE